MPHACHLSPARFLTIALTAGLLFVSLPSFGASLFLATDPLPVTLTGPLSDLMKARGSETRDFTLEVEGASFSATAAVSDVSRLKVCRYAPLELTFGDDARSGLFADHKKVTLLLPCRDNDRSDQDVLDEYGAHRVYDYLSDIALRTRPAYLNVIDTGSKKSRIMVRYGVIVESPEALAARTGAELVRAADVSPDQLNQDQAALTYVFQYMIANTDYSLAPGRDGACCHNGVLLDKGDGYLLIPRDFDRSGMVNAKYAAPYRDLGQMRIRQRLYRGYCISELAIRKAMTDMMAKQFDMLQVLSSVPVAVPGEARKTTTYVLRYFSEAQNSNKVITHFNQFCRDGSNIADSARRP